MTAPSVSGMTGVARQYLADVEREFSDLPVEERAELLEDLALHLEALEADADEQPWETRLGAAAEYARELRAAAGLPERTASSTGRMEAARALVRQVAHARAVREAAVFLPQLRPAWWVMRGYLIVLVPCLWAVDRTQDFPVPQPNGSRALGAVLTVAAVIASVAVGRRKLPRAVGGGVLLGNVVLLAMAAGLVHDAPDRLARLVVVQSAVDNVATGSSPLVSRHGPVTNVLPYAADGRPLSGVLLFDQDGRPLQVGRQLWWPDDCRRVLAAPLAADGVPVTFSFPQSYVVTPESSYLGGGRGTPCLAVLPTPKVPLPVFPQPSPTRP